MLWIVLVTVFVTLPSELPKFWSAGLVDATEPTPVADTFACPDPMAMFSYFNYGLSDETADCSVIVFSDISPESLQSFGTYPMTYFDWTAVDDALTEPPYVEIFIAEYRGLELFVITDYVDEHVLEEPPGLRGGVVYTIWEDHPPSS